MVGNEDYRKKSEEAKNLSNQGLTEKIDSMGKYIAKGMYDKGYVIEYRIYLKEVETRKRTRSFVRRIGLPKDLSKYYAVLEKQK